MGTRTIRISDDAYVRLSRLKCVTTMSFSEVIFRFTPPRKKLSEILKEPGPNQELADSIERASREMRKATMREVDFDANT
ncbi:MAG: antitoxin [Methanocalculus sp. MSAO_Arc2]|uniref:antitoxin VapB family protein n=1 Tax=Methanocalculus sp. MSAO_Arc2 TaxID=2293855 RepID=UPI000FF0B7E7|nr:MAG: antitoxin [Methanocalculus sp. MSAO_Arc2]